MSKSKKKRVSPAARRNMPSLREFWEELNRRCGTIGETGTTSGSSGWMGGSARGLGSGSRLGSRFGSRSGSRLGSRFGDDENALGYGLGLIVPDYSAEERVQMILHMLVEKDAEREKQRKKAKATRG